MGGGPADVIDDGAIYCETHLLIAKDVSKAAYDKVLLRCSNSCSCVLERRMEIPKQVSLVLSTTRLHVRLVHTMATLFLLVVLFSWRC